MKKYVKLYWFEYVFALVTIVAIAVVITMKFGYIYSTNDDVMMNSIINGAFSGISDIHLVFISSLLTSVWRALYNIMPEVAWYDWFMVILHYLCWFFIVVRLGQQGKTQKTKAVIMLCVAALLMVIDLKYLVLLQFTVISAKLSGVAVLWMLTQKEHRGVECHLDYFVILATLWMSFLIRKEPFLLALPIIGLGILLNVWKHVKDKKSRRNIIQKATIYAVVLGILCLGAGITDKIAYAEDGWSDFMRSQDARPQIYDYSGVPPMGDYEEAYRDLDIDYADWMAIYTYNCELADDFNAEKMEGVAELSIHSRDSWRAVSNNIDLIKKSVYAFCIRFFENGIQPIGLVLVIGYAIALLLCYRTDNKKTGMAILAIMLFYTAVFLYLIDQNRFPERVVYGMYFVQLMSLMAFVSGEAEQVLQSLKKEKFWLGLLVTVSAMIWGCAFLYSWQIIKDERTQLLQKAEAWEYVNDYFATNSDNRYCLETGSFVFATEKLFVEKVESDNVIYLGGWMLNSPLQQQRMERLGVDNLLQQVAEDEHFYIVQEEWEETAWIDTICSEKGYDVKAVIVDVIITPGGRTFEVIQMQPANG